MRAALVTPSTSGPESIEAGEIETPTRGDGEVLIEVKAAGVNFPDLLLSQDKYQLKPDRPFVLGGELAGLVVDAPVGSEFVPGDRVAATSTLNGFAEFASVRLEDVFPLPHNMSFAAGACVTMNYLTMSFAITTRGALKPGETVLVQGAAGGIGTATIQLAAAYGARVIGVVSSERKADFIKSVGAHEAVLVDGFKEAVRELTNDQGVDIVADPVGGDRFTDSLRCLAPQGRMLVVGFTAGDIPTVKVNRLLLNNLDVRGVGWGNFAFSKPGYVRKEWDKLVPLMEKGQINPPISATFSIDEVGAAVAGLGTREVLGKNVIVFGD
ncbi:NADPH:quinone oxidoreductase family protein [Cumulibacter soli]|uniref:NADPH:quinone oxidoreductase family protein n=1 Tax=Cumulibacter soli TaxID=2546344 RepID=UPI0010678F39|nr:NADPH:quinone oxidoreductase family protein [Cumulibacter soli]